MKRIVILFVVVVVLILGWTAAWFYGANLVRQNIIALAGADGQATPRLTCGRLDVGGWPFWFDVTCEKPDIVSGDLTFAAAEIKATAEAFDPFQIVAQATGPLTIEDAFTGSKERLDWTGLKASARLTGWRIGRISVVADGLALASTTGGDQPIAKAAHAEAHLLDMPERYDAAKHLATLHGFARLDHLQAPGFQLSDMNSTLDATIDSLPDDVRTMGDPDLLAHWQAAGGKLVLNGLKGNEGDDTFNVTGHLALDSSAHPMGQLTVNSKGLVDRLGGLVPEQLRTLILGQPAADGSYSQTLNFTNGMVFAGLIPIGAVPALY
ncbi:MAG TPA: DUF2125 domain-containing protein [Devosia sp.]|nr:DUF2125 domain-containing protein [Devosia sp.]